MYNSPEYTDPIAPLGNLNCISDTITEKIQTLKKVGERLELLSAHDFLFLLIHSFSMSKLMYLLCTALCFKVTGYRGGVVYLPTSSASSYCTVALSALKTIQYEANDTGKH